MWTSSSGNTSALFCWRRKFLTINLCLFLCVQEILARCSADEGRPPDLRGRESQRTRSPWQSLLSFGSKRNRVLRTCSFHRWRVSVYQVNIQLYISVSLSVCQSSTRSFHRWRVSVHQVYLYVSKSVSLSVPDQVFSPMTSFSSSG